MSTTLTDRYVWAVVRSIPEQQRADIERELRASLGDDIEARIEAGADARAAEYEALKTLGDPGQLSASYSGRPNYLVGPRYYFDYLRLVKLLLAIVLPIAAVVMVVVNTFSGADIGGIIGGSIASLLTVALHLVFWTTLIFVVLERTDGGLKAAGTEWMPEYLPQVPDPKAGAGLSELVASGVFLVLFGAALIWQQLSSVFRDTNGDPIPVLQPELWGFWLPYLLVLIALELVFAIVIYVRRGWNWTMALINVALNLAFVVPAIWLWSEGRILNPEFLDRLDWWNAASPWVALASAGIVLLAVAGDIIDGFLKARRASKRV